jgi:hypothetical protein
MLDYFVRILILLMWFGPYDINMVDFVYPSK